MKGKKKELVGAYVYLREPILIRFFNNNIWETLKALKLTVPALIGEIFREEQKELSDRYEGIIRPLLSAKIICQKLHLIFIPINFDR